MQLAAARHVGTACDPQHCGHGPTGREPAAAAIKVRALSLLGLPQLAFDGTASLEINSTASRVTRSLNVGGVNRTLDVGPNLERLALRNVLATFTDFVELSGDFSVEKVVSGNTTTLQLAASSVGAFLGVQRGQADEFGVRVSNASAALIIEKTAGTAAKFAARTNVGTVSIPGLPDLDLRGGPGEAVGVMLLDLGAEGRFGPAWLQIGEEFRAKADGIAEQGDDEGGCLNTAQAPELVNPCCCEVSHAVVQSRIYKDFTASDQAGLLA